MKNFLTAFGSTVVLLALTNPAHAHSSDRIEADEGSGYVVSSDGGVLLSGNGSCIRHGGWSEDNQINACEGIEEPVAEPEPEPVAEPEPTPEPVPAPKEPTITLATLGGEALFATNSDELNPAGEAALTELVGQLVTFQEIESIEVTGHTDSTGAESYNQDLSERRAQTVAAFLGGAFPDVSIASAGAGELSPIDTNDTPEGRQANRRVDIQVTAKSVTE